ncbi:hypothetical protein [Luteolibacter sp. AS25]|uniref:hypothetical protein n=1 Tax=Luteolibacter sp. AS25 TaxID=3135776 RepID=UPI00398AECAA
MKTFALLLPFACIAMTACERHEFEGPNGTKQLHEHHGAHDEHAENGDPHDEHEKGHDEHGH